ncbi:hypothetical protein Pa4123_92430 [Phytohabitans aurantiacus]|uniref:Uncharacterized protein n=1 Tax=Phytohabitans aurantiacus TaxID=3016789 RepID=A0ABQ5RB44_9ACTN|nr:hypothetical protein Pa4123_92430 [Phytohabitans aurantiacus]
MFDEAAFHTEPAPHDVEPFIGPWNATAPETAYRSDDTRKQHEIIRAYEISWHCGMHPAHQKRRLPPPLLDAPVHQRHGGAGHHGAPQRIVEHRLADNGSMSTGLVRRVQASQRSALGRSSRTCSALIFVAPPLVNLRR